ncbi:MAG: hypothetical protein A3K18_28250 [Lentisphaerae bacterium RIFOXYA12_64_32]|nr:MAG: hypothetical protein A3K18_28250 [Lentisphaerae bacterium RIFOXYA12_64_32]
MRNQLSALVGLLTGLILACTATMAAQGEANARLSTLPLSQAQLALQEQAKVLPSLSQEAKREFVKEIQEVLEKLPVVPDKNAKDLAPEERTALDVKALCVAVLVVLAQQGEGEAVKQVERLKGSGDRWTKIFLTSSRSEVNKDAGGPAPGEDFPKDASFEWGHCEIERAILDRSLPRPHRTAALQQALSNPDFHGAYRTAGHEASREAIVILIEAEHAKETDSLVADMLVRVHVQLGTRQRTKEFVKTVLARPNLPKNVQRTAQYYLNTFEAAER